MTLMNKDPREHDREYYKSVGIQKFMHDETRGEQYAWRRVMRLVEPDSSHSILDVGCGLGQHTFYLAGRCAEAVGIDTSHDAIEFAKKKFQADNLRYLCADVADVDFGRRFDQAALLSVLEHMTQEQHNRVMEALSRLIVPGGVLNVAVPTGKTRAARSKLKKRGHDTLDYTGDPMHVRSFTPGELVRDVERFGFKLEASEFDYARTLVSGATLMRIARVCLPLKRLLGGRVLSAYLRFRRKN